MASGNFFQNEVLTNFIYPFFLLFFIIFAILEKTKVLGDGKKQINALVALVISLIFVSVAYPKMVVGNMILFLTVALVIVFVALLLWGFISGSELKDGGFLDDKVKKVLAVVVIVAVIFASLWATGLSDAFFGTISDFDFGGMFFTNLLFIVVVAVALAVAIKTGSSGK